MARSVHDNYLVSYEVFSEQRRIVLRTEYRGGRAAPEVTSVIFTKVEGYHFEVDCFDQNILFDVERVPVERILEEHGDEIGAVAHHVTWPWVKNLSQAGEWLRSRGVEGFLIDASVGMSGWVLAASAVLAPEPTASVDLAADGLLRPGLYEIASDGSQRRLEGKRLIAALGGGRELAFTLPEPGWREDEVYVRSFFNGPGGDVQSEWGRGPRPETWSSIVVHPGEGTSMTLTVEARRASDGALVEGPAPLFAAPAKRWYAVEGEVRKSLEGRTFVLSLGEGRAVTLDAVASGGARDGVHVYAGTLPTPAEVESVNAGGPLTLVPMAVGFGGANVLNIRLGTPYGARPMEPVRARPTT